MNIDRAIKEFLEFNEMVLFLIGYNESSNSFVGLFSWSINLATLLIGLVALFIAIYQRQKAHLFAVFSFVMSELYVIIVGLFYSFRFNFIHFIHTPYVIIQIVLLTCLIYYSRKMTRIPAIIFFVFCSYSALVSSLVGTDI